MTSPSSPSAPSAEQSVVVEQDGGVATVRINRPGEMCALDNATKDALLQALTQVADDPTVRCVVLTGTGRAFCVGQDLKEHVEGLRADPGALGETVTRHYNPIATLLATMPKPVVAALNGTVAGAGLSFALAADVRLAIDSVVMTTAFAGIALSCDSGASWHLPRIVGPVKAKNLLLFPRPVKGPEALELGLVDQLVAADEFEGVVRETAERLAAGPTVALGSIRRAVAYGLGHSLEDSLANEKTYMDLTGTTSDHAAAVSAFLAKEKPTFEGR